MRDDKAYTPHTETGDTDAHATVPELKPISFSAKCLCCQSDQLLESRFVGYGKSGWSDVEVWSISLCKSCIQKRLRVYLNNEMKGVIICLALCVLFIVVGLDAILSGPEMPPEGFVWTPQGKAFHGWIGGLGMIFGFFSVLAFPMCMGLLVRAFIARIRLHRSQAVGTNIADKVYADAAKGLTEEACTKLGVPLPFGSQSRFEYDVIGAGQTPEATITV